MHENGALRSAYAETDLQLNPQHPAYKGGAVHCGTCGTCVERREAFILAKLPDPTIYESNDPLPEKPKPF